MLRGSSVSLSYVPGMTNTVYFYSKYYEKDSLVSDAEYGSILSSLLGEHF